MKKALSTSFAVQFFGLFAAFALLSACSDQRTTAPSEVHGHPHDHGEHHAHYGEDHAHEEDHAPPHGGTPVLVAEDKFHLELVLDQTTGTMQAYVLDGHLEKYVPVPETEFIMVANAGGKEERLTFERVPEPGAEALPEKSSLFAAEAQALNGVEEFEGNIPAVTLNGTTFTNIVFSFPEGSKHVH